MDMTWPACHAGCVCMLDAMLDVCAPALGLMSSVDLLLMLQLKRTRAGLVYIHHTVPRDSPGFQNRRSPNHIICYEVLCVTVAFSLLKYPEDLLP